MIFYVFSEVLDAGQIIDIVQMQQVKRSTKIASKPIVPAVKQTIQSVPRLSAPVKAVKEFTPLKFDQVIVEKNVIEKPVLNLIKLIRFYKRLINKKAHFFFQN
jgi:hypothetical protein